MSLLGVVWFLANVPLQFRILSTAIENNRAARLGILDGQTYAAVSIALDAVFVAVSTAVAYAFFRRRGRDFMALLRANALVVFGVFNGLFLQTPTAYGDFDVVLW